MSKHSPNIVDRGDGTMLQVEVTSTPIVFHDPSISIVSSEGELSSQAGSSSQVEATGYDSGAGIDPVCQHLQLPHSGLLSSYSRLGKLRRELIKWGRRWEILVKEFSIHKTGLIIH
ncbi:hypothetical protein Nepgr_012512 [Nepenthes gracilis]|uniref:Uncharacterized protein n=1 Tax=Nepenthes gracilis TaxID=150966 RepID=A0AAD3SH37_NEPGR|nr:hypothetical protein Nepgr_012512 [Nepenthes gracilis]